MIKQPKPQEQCVQAQCYVRAITRFNPSMMQDTLHVNQESIYNKKKTRGVYRLAMGCVRIFRSLIDVLCAVVRIATHTNIMFQPHFY